MTSATKVQWRVQVRVSRNHKWCDRGLFETRKDARAQAAYLRIGRVRNRVVMTETGFGFGNTRVTRYVKGQK